MAALSLTEIHAYYGKAHVVQGVSLAIEPGQIVGIFGRNGVGKTTLLRAALNLVGSSAGSVTLHGADISGLSTDARVRRGIAYMPQGVRVFPDMTVEDNYRIAAYAVRRPRPLPDIIALLPELQELLSRRAGRLSGGQQQMVSLMRSLAVNCSVLLMDEPTEGLMPRMVERIAAAIRMLAAQNVAILLVEQNLLLGEAVCDRIHLMEKGRIEAEGSFADLRSDGAFARVLGV